MTRIQFELMANKSIRNQKLRQAVRLHLFEGCSARKAEIRVFGKQTNTVFRCASRLEAELEYCLKVTQFN